MSRRLYFSTANTTWYVAPSIRHPVRDCSKGWHRPKTKHTCTVFVWYDHREARIRKSLARIHNPEYGLHGLHKQQLYYELSPIRSFNIYHARLERYRHLHVAARMTWFPRSRPFLQQSRAPTYTEHMGHSWIEDNEIQGTVCIRTSPTSPENISMKGHCGRRVFTGLRLVAK